MSEPYWSALGAAGGVGSVDYENVWAAGTQYLAGDVVTYNGVYYLAVNPSLGSTPPVASPAGLSFATALPTGFFDGQEAILVDSVSAPTYAWRFRYTPAKATNKWVFVGGSPLASGPLGSITTSSVTAVALTNGPAVAIPVTGEYLIEWGLEYNQSGTTSYLSTSSLSGSVMGDDSTQMLVSNNGASSIRTHASKLKKFSALAVQTLTLKVWSGSAISTSFGVGYIKVTPVAVGG